MEQTDKHLTEEFDWFVVFRWPGVLDWVVEGVSDAVAAVLTVWISGNDLNCEEQSWGCPEKLTAWLMDPIAYLASRQIKGMKDALD